MLPGLLIALAVPRVEDASSSLMRVAREWVQERLWDDRPSEPEWPWLGLLQTTLIATSVLEATGSDIEFLHQSIAEYLAADPKVRTLDYRTLKSELSDPARRSLGLFTLARSGQPIAPIVRGLLDGDDPLSAGHVLAEGFAVDEELRQDVLMGLLESIRCEHSSAVECLAVLTELAVNQRTRADLTAVVEDSKEGPWTRALIADSLAELHPDLGARLLREVATDRRIANESTRVWATQRLRTRGDEFSSHIRREIGPTGANELAESGRLAAHALPKNRSGARYSPRRAPRCCE